MPTKQHSRVTSASDGKSRGGNDDELIASQHDKENEKAVETEEKLDELKKEDEEVKMESEEEEEEEGIILDDSDSEEEVEEDEEEMGGERLIELSSDDDDDEASLKMHARGMLTFVAAEFIPILRKIDERQCLKMIPCFEKSDRIKYEKHLAEVLGSANPKSIKEVNEPLTVRPAPEVVAEHFPQTSVALGTSDGGQQQAGEGGPKEASSNTTRKGKDSSTKTHCAGPPYTIEEFYTPLPTIAQERQRFEYVALSVTPRFVKLVCNPDSDFVETRRILDSIVASTVTKNENATDAVPEAKKSRIEIESDRFKNPRILNISAKRPAECVVEYGPTRGERPVLFDPANIWDHFEGGWTRKKLSKHKNQFWTKCYKDNASKAAMFMSLVRRRLEEERAGDKAPTPISEAELAALEYLAENDPYFHLKLPPFGCRAHRFIYEDPLLDVLMAIPLRKYDLIFAYGALARMGPNEENLGDYSLKQQLTLKAFKDNGFILGDTPKTGVFGDPKMVVFALDALIPEDEGGDLEIRERAWLAEAHGFGLVVKAHPVMAAFALAASVIYWRLVAIGERPAEEIDAVFAFFNLMRAAAQYDYEETTLVKKLQKSYAKKINKKTGLKSRQVKPESITPDMFTEADFAPLLNYRNAFVTNRERTRKTLMHELARITNLPNAALWPEEEARLNAIRHWSEAEKERATQPTARTTTRDEQPPCERQRGKKWGAGPWGCAEEAAKAKVDERLRILNMTSEVLWGLSAQRMCQTDAEGREPYLNLEKTLLTDVGDNVNYFGEWVGKPEEEEQAKSLVQLMPYETRNNIRRWKTPFGDGGVCYSDLFNGLPPPGAYVLSGEDALTDTADAAVPLSTKGTTAHIGPFPLDCSFATPHRHIRPKKPLSLLRHFLCALNTEGEPHYWAAFGDYLADVRSHDKQAGKAKQAPRPLVSFPIPHPMQIFDVKLTNPVVSLDCLAACDMCSRRNLRLGYEARKTGNCGPRPLADPSLLADCNAPAATDIYPHLESLASVLPKSLAGDAPELHVPKRVVGREHFQFMDNFQQCGFDICVTCAAAMVHEAHVALLSTVGVLMVVAPISPASAESAADGVCNGEAKSADVLEGARTAPKPSCVVALDDELGQVVSRRVTAESSAGVPDGVIVLEREVRIGTIGSRPSIAINNQLRVAGRAKVKLVQEGDEGVGGVLHLYVAVSPIGARPIARVWGEGYSDLLVQSALARTSGGSGVQHGEDDEAAAHYPDYAEHPLYVAGQRVVSAAAVLRQFLANATRVATRQLCNFRSKGAEVVAVGEDEDDEECPICLELLNFVGGGAGAGPAMRREATVSMVAAGSSETDEARRAADFRGQQLALPGSQLNNVGAGGVGGGQLTRCDSSFSHASSRGGEEDGEGAGLDVGGGIAVAKQTSCGHWFHPQCLERFMVNNKTTTCPVCRCPNALESLAVKQMRAVERTRRARRVARTRRLIEDIQATNANAALNTVTDEDTSAVVANAADVTLPSSTVATTKIDANPTEGTETAEENEEDEEVLEECEGEEEEAEEWSDVDDLPDDEEEEENGSKGGGEEGFVSAEMIVAATRQTLEQNIYEVRIPLTQGQARHFASSSFAASDSLLLPSRSPLSVVVGTIVSTDSEYRTPMDLGCVARLEIEF